MIQFNISQMAASVLNDNVKLSALMRSQIASAPAKADIWIIRCEKEELLGLSEKLKNALDINSNLHVSVATLVQDELTEICNKHM